MPISNLNNDDYDRGWMDGADAFDNDQPENKPMQILIISIADDRWMMFDERDMPHRAAPHYGLSTEEFVQAVKEKRGYQLFEVGDRLTFEHALVSVADISGANNDQP